MRIAVISDTHLGAKWGTEREMDSFDQAREAIGRALGLGAELILMLGDLFDSRIPQQDVWAHALRILSLPLAKDGRIKLNRAIDKNLEDISPVALRGVPIVALHGNHERRTRGLFNPIQTLEAAGHLMYLHHGALVFDTRVGELAIHGMSYVPERQARNALLAWNPKPVKGAFNILMLHQSVGQYVFSGEEGREEPTIDLPDLPAGFDLYLCGHIHNRAETKVHGKPLLFPGSTERTQLVQLEAQSPKGFFLIDIDGGLSYEFIELKCPRDFFFEEMTFSNVKIPELISAVRARIRELLGKPRRNLDKLPLIRLRLLGTLAREASRSEIDEKAIVQEFADRAIISISKGDLAAPGLEEKVQLLRDLRGKRLPIDEMAMTLLLANLKETGYNEMFEVHALYDLLVEGKLDEALKKVLWVVEDRTRSELGR